LGLTRGKKDKSAGLVCLVVNWLPKSVWELVWNEKGQWEGKPWNAFHVPRLKIQRYLCGAQEGKCNPSGNYVNKVIVHGFLTEKAQIPPVYGFTRKGYSIRVNLIRIPITVFLQSYAP